MASEQALLEESDRRELSAYLAEQLVGPVDVWLFADVAEAPAHELDLSREAHQVMTEFCALSPHLRLHHVSTTHDHNGAMGIVRWPAIALSRGDAFSGVRFYGIPAGYEFAGFLETVIDVSQGGSPLEAPGQPDIQADIQADLRADLEALRASGLPVRIEVVSTPNCPYCPVAAHAAAQLALELPLVTADCINALEFPELVEQMGVQSVPHVVIEGRYRFVGAVTEGALLRHVLTALNLSSAQFDPRRVNPSAHVPHGPTSPLSNTL